MNQGLTAAVLVGRSRELAALDAAFERVRRGQPSTVLIGGEAGVGKSRLVSEYGTRARIAADARVLSGCCLELSAEGLPFAPFTGVLRELVRDVGADGVAALLPARGAQDLARLLPELGEPSARADPGEARVRMFEHVLVLLGHLAESGPVILVIEDAHWSDRSTRDLLAFLVGNQRVLDGVLIVVTFRSDELHRGHPLRPVLAQLGRLGWVTRLDLPRLTRREAREFMTGLLGRQPEPGLADRLYARSEGNPLFLEALLSRDDLERELPESLRDLVLAEARRLPAGAQEVLEALAVSGQAGRHALLAAVTGIGERALLAAVRSAVSANVLMPEADGYAFRHALIREAILGEVLPADGARLHSRVAEALAADPSLVPPGRAVIEQAHHWYLAHNNLRALESAWQAAAAATRSLAYAEKLAMLARVLELWDTQPDAPARIGATRLDVLESAADTAPAAGEDERGIGFATAALKEIDTAAEPARAAMALIARAQMRWNLGRAEGIQDLYAALRLVPPGVPGPARGQALSWLATWPDTSGRWDRAAAEEALRASREVGDAATEAYVLMTLTQLEFRERGVVSLDLLEQARALGEQGDAHDVLLGVAIHESHLLEGVGEHERAVRAARRGLASAREYGMARSTHGTMLAANLVESLASLGRWDEAADVTEHALELSPPPGMRAVLLQLAGELALAHGDLASAAESAAGSRAALARFGYRDQNHLPLARLEAELRLAQDRAGDALTVAEQALDRSGQDQPRYAWPLVVTGARACRAALTGPAAASDPNLAERARRLLDRLRAQAATMDAFGPLQHAHRLTFAAEAAEAAEAAAAGAPAAAAASTEAAAGEAAHTADALAAWDAATRAWDGLGQPYPLARSLLRAAQAAIDHGDRDGAAERLARAAPLAEALGAGPLREQIGSLARRARLGLPSAPSDGQPSGILGLTTREIEVLRLVAVGRSNREIAAELFISAKTASVHVSNILAKLSAGSRTEAAAIALREGLAAAGP